MPTEEELVEAKLVDRLKDLGLTEYEAYALVDLTLLGTGTAKDISRQGNVPRTRVYDAMQTLHEMGLVDVQHTTPKKFTVVSRESIVRKFNVERENTIERVADLFADLGPVEPQREQAGVWTVTGRASVAKRADKFIDGAESKVIYMTVDELLTDEHIERLQAAGERGVSIHLAGISEDVYDRIREDVPSVELFETLWEWADTPAGRLLITDEQAALVSVRLDERETEQTDETAIWGQGGRNSLVVVLRAIFTWRLDDNEIELDGEP